MSLDDKLREILEDWYPGTQYEEVIPKLKQAFADDNYVQVAETPVGLRFDARSGTMTGQEWYDRFEKNTVGQLFKYRTDGEQNLVAEVASFFVEAAKKASGLAD